MQPTLPQLSYTSKEYSSSKYEFNLDEDIKEPSYYRTLIEVLNNATEQDLVVLNINSGGGLLIFLTFSFVFRILIFDVYNFHLLF